MKFLEELKRSKSEQASYKTVFNNFKDKELVCPTGPSGPGGGSWWWVESSGELRVSNEIKNTYSKKEK